MVRIYDLTPRAFDAVRGRLMPLSGKGPERDGLPNGRPCLGGGVVLGRSLSRLGVRDGGRMARLEPRLGRSKAIVAIARCMLVAVWHMWSDECSDKHADTVQVAKTIFGYAYKLGTHNLPDGMSALMYTRYHLDQLGLGQDLTHLPWGKKRYKLPPSKLARQKESQPG